MERLSQSERVARALRQVLDQPEPAQHIYSVNKVCEQRGGGVNKAGAEMSKRIAPVIVLCMPGSYSPD